MATIPQVTHPAKVLTSSPTADDKAQECVLLIEDSEEAMWLVEDAIKEYGKGKFRLEWAQDLREGLLYLSKNTAAVILLDLGLPDSSGPSSCSAIRKIVPNVPVLVLTADNRPETAQQVIASGSEDYLVKDEISGVLLVRAINAVLYQSRNPK